MGPVQLSHVAPFCLIASVSLVALAAWRSSAPTMCLLPQTPHPAQPCAGPGLRRVQAHSRRGGPRHLKLTILFYSLGTHLRSAHLMVLCHEQLP